MICLLQPGAVEDAVVMVTHGAELGGGGTGQVVCQCELGHELSEERTQAACDKLKGWFNNIKPSRSPLLIDKV